MNDTSEPTAAVLYKREGDIGFITVRNPPVNALGHAVRAGLARAILEGVADHEAKALVLLGEGRTFPAGADIREFGKPMAEPGLPTVIESYENAAKPVVAAIHGTALGGGLELALGCHYRVGVESAVVGLPEVKLGLLPGAGGTQRLPRLAGVEAAIGMITTGRRVTAIEAARLGILDEVSEADSAEEAGRAFARRVIDDVLPVRRTRDLGDRLDVGSAFFEAERERVAARARGQLSPSKCLEAIRGAVELTFEEGLKRERELFAELMEHPQRTALIHAFFGEREVAKVPGIAVDAKPREVKHVGIVGAGTMGGGIAMCFADAGIPVTLVEAEADALKRGIARIEANYRTSEKRGRLTAGDVAERLDRISGSLDMADLGKADLVVEAAFEKMNVKRDVFSKLDGVAKAGAVLATNTSYLDVDEIAAATGRPEDVLGMHFFSPANVMRLLEVVRAGRTADDVLLTALDIGRRLGKVAVVSGVGDGFIGNRMLEAYWKQCVAMVEDGALPREVDAAMEDFGFAMGPFRVGDLAGLDIGYFNRRRKDTTRPKDERYVDLADRLYDMGRLGQKTGAGWYRYEEGSRTAHADPEIEAMIVAASKEKGIERRDFSKGEIRGRALSALANEGAKILEDGIAARPVDIDMVWLHGYGFPAHEGGPMFWADARGLDAVLSDVTRFGKEDAASWRPAPLLKELAEQGRTFRAWAAERA